MAKGGNIQVGALHASLSMDSGNFMQNAAKAQASLGGIVTGFAKTDAAINKTSTQFNKAGQSASNYTRQANAANAANANLVANFNDIAVMMAAGQNPLQLAMQQGTQISQVLTGMGGGVGALKAVGSAFIGMLNPVSLATIGIIGFGAAAFQWLMPAKEEAEKAKDSFDALADSAKNYKDALGVNLLYTGEAEKQYGEQAQRGSEIARRIMEIEAKKTRDSVSRIMSEAYSAAAMGVLKEGNQSVPYSVIGEAMGFSGNSWFTAGGFKAEDLQLAKDYADQIARIQSLVSSIDITKFDMQDFAGSMDQELANAQAILDKAIEQGAAEETIAQHRQRLIDLQNALLIQAHEVAQVKAADEAKANEMLSTMEQQANMHQLINQYGADSIEVRQAELAAEHEKQRAAIETLNIASELEGRLYAAADANYAAESATLAWADAMARVNAQLTGAIGLLNSIGGGMIQRAGISAANRVLDEGGKVIDAEKARRRAEESNRLYQEEDRLIAEGKSSAAVYEMKKAEQERQWAEEDKYQERISAASAAEREAAKAARGGGGGRKKGSGRAKLTDEAKEAQREARREESAYKTLQERLDLLRSGFGKTALEKEILNQQIKIGSAQAPEAVAAMVTQIDQIERWEDAMGEARNTFTDSFAAIITGAKSAREVLANVLSDMANRMAKTAANSFFDRFVMPAVQSWIGGPSGGGDALTAALAAAGAPIPGNANGTPPGGFQGNLSWVGERGRELVQLPKGAQVIPHHKSERMLAGSGQIPAVHISVDEGLKAELLNDAARQSAQISQTGIREFSRNELPSKLKNFQRDQRAHG